MKTLYNVVLFVLVLFGSVVPADAQGTRVNAVQVDGVVSADDASYVHDTEGNVYRFDAADTTAVNAIDTMLYIGSFVDPSLCENAYDPDGRRCGVLYLWMDTEWTTVYPSPRQCRQDAADVFSSERYESCLLQENERRR